MAQKSSIEWTESTWNPISGCTKHSAGCVNCYAEKMALRLQSMGQEKYKNGFQLSLHPDALEIPLTLKKPQVIFVCSMSDIFHKNVPDEYIFNMFDVMNRAHWHTFQILTKRADRLDVLSSKLNWTRNIWMGVTVEDQDNIWRIDHLKRCGASIKFLSIEPLIGPIDHLPLENIDWVIVGGESGQNARPMMKEWVLDIQNYCERAKVSFYFKQWGGKNKKKNGRLLNGKTYDDMPGNLLSA